MINSAICSWHLLSNERYNMGSNNRDMGQSEVQLNNTSLKILKCDKIDAYCEGNRYTGILLYRILDISAVQNAKFLHFK